MFNTDNRLTLLESRVKKHRGKWQSLFLCDCGKSKLARECEVNSGHIRSCGCMRAEVSRLNISKARGKKLSHPVIGKTRDSQEYNIWIKMKQRCADKTNKLYGGRGISVCKEWSNSFEAFYSDIGPRPGIEFSIERIDNDGNYAPSNCKWATRTEQARNRRSNVVLSAYGVSMTITEWAGILEVPSSRLNARKMRHKWSDHDTLFTAKVPKGVRHNV